MNVKSHALTIHWAWLIPLFLLLMWVVGTRLDVDGFWYDEVFTVRNAGGAGYTPSSLSDWYDTILRDDPYQALGYPFLVGVWGRVAGWSEYALRFSSLLFALIGMAVTYRLGRDATRSDAVGLLSAVIFGFSTFTVHYAHELRAFTFVTVFAGLLLWAYWRLLYGRASVMAYVWLVVAGIGLLYAHYYAAMLLLALGLYHVLFVSKTRRWGLIALCGVVMGLFFLPQVPAFIEGLTRFDPNSVEKTPMGADAVVTTLLYYIGNGTVVITALLIVIGVVLAFVQKSPMRMVIGIGIFATLVLIISNELLDILEPTRIRYAIFLWSIFAVWLAYALVGLIGYVSSLTNQPSMIVGLFGVMLAFWLGNALFANYTVGFNESIEGTETPRLRTITNVLREDGSGADLFAFYNGTSGQAWYIQDTLTYSVWDIPMPTLTTASLYDVNESTRLWARDQIDGTQRVWYGANRTFGLNQVHDDFVALLNEDFILCDTPVMTDDLSLELYARSEVFCGEGQEVAIGGFTLTDHAVTVRDETLVVQLGLNLDDTIAPDTYSVSVQVMDDTSEVVLTQDAGIPFDRFVPMALSLDVSDLSSGEYEVLLVIYAWRTGERLTVAGDDTYELGSVVVE